MFQYQLIVNYILYNLFFCFSSDILHPKILHLHGIWDLLGNLLLLKYKCSKKLVIVSPHGMLDPYSLSTKRFKKKVALFLYQRRNLNNCDVIHSTSDKESQNIRKLGFVRPIAMIPIGINTNDYPLKKFQNKEQKKVLFLSRIHPKKGLDILIDLWASLDANTLSNWCLEIAGLGEQSYLAELMAKVKKYDLQANIKFIGEVSGQKKVDTFHSADIFILPSLGENFGIVVLEALSCGLPVITTTSTPWEILGEHKLGRCVDHEFEEIRGALIEMMAMTDTEFINLSVRCRDFVEKYYNHKIFARNMNHLYQWLEVGGDKPDFIFN